MNEHINDQNMEAARNLASIYSDDPDTQTGCLAVLTSGVMTFAANTLPTDVRKTEERLQRPDKYNYIGHAEENLIAKAASSHDSLFGAKVYINWFPCAPCARMLVNARITELVVDAVAYRLRKDDPRYSFAEALNILIEGGVKITWWEEKAA